MRPIIFAAWGALCTLVNLPVAAGSEDHHHHDTAEFSAGEPGDPKEPARTIEIIMRESDGKMIFIPDRVEVRKGEQIKFELHNVGELDHEFVLATTNENLEHAAAMQRNPEMEHEDPDARRLAPKNSAELVWKFTKAGQFEFACLIPGHREAGMFGAAIVK